MKRLLGVARGVGRVLLRTGVILTRKELNMISIHEKVPACKHHIFRSPTPRDSGCTISPTYLCYLCSYKKESSRNKKCSPYRSIDHRRYHNPSDTIGTRQTGQQLHIPQHTHRTIVHNKHNPSRISPTLSSLHSHQSGHSSAGPGPSWRENLGPH